MRRSGIHLLIGYRFAFSRFTQIQVWPCQKADFPAQLWATSSERLSELTLRLDLSLTLRISIALVETSDGALTIKMSIDSGKQCLDWRDASTDVAQTYEVRPASV